MSMVTERKERSARWAVPVTSAVIGVAYLVAGIVGQNIGFGLIGLAIMLAFGAVFVVLGRYSETARGLLDRRDERINTIDRDATLFAGAVLLAVVLGMFVVEIAQGKDGAPYYWLGALAGVSYLLAVVWLRFRR